MPRFLLLVLFYFLSALWLQAQNKIDSLFNWIVAHPDSCITPIWQLQPECKAFPADQLLSHANKFTKALQHSKAVNKIEVYKFFGAVCWEKGMFKESLSFFNQAINLADASGNPKEVGSCHMMLAENFMENEMYVNALDRAYKAREAFSETNNKFLEARAYCKAAVIGFRAGNYMLSIEEITRALQLYEQLNPADFTHNDSLSFMNAYNTCGLVHGALKEYEKAIACYDKAEKMASLLNNSFWIALINGNKGNIFYNQGKIDEALRALLVDFRVSISFREWSSAISTGNFLSNLYIQQGKWDKAKYYLDTTAVLLSKYKVLKNAKAGYWSHAAKYFQHFGDYQKAYEAMRQNNLIRDSMDFEHQVLSLARIKASYDIQQKQGQIDLLTAENKLHAQQLANKNIMVTASIVSVLLVFALAFTLYRSYRQKQRDNLLLAEKNDKINAINGELRMYTETLSIQNLMIQKINGELEHQVKKRTKQLEDANSELDMFLYSASHDIRRPITTLLGLSNLARHSPKEAELTQIFDKVIDTASSMDSMLYKLQMVYELNRPLGSGSDVFIGEVINNVYIKFAKTMKKYGIDFHVQISENIHFSADERLVAIIFQNLIENAIMFRAQDNRRPYIEITAEQRHDQVIFVVSDNGIGIEPEYLERIFDLHFRATELSKGNGLGLYLVKKAVTLLEGKIEVTSEHGEGSNFVMHFPADT
jgi:signal transduction histidine kinase